MTFWQSFFPTFSGALLGFIFSIVLFYITNKLNANKNKKTLESNLIKELEYNLAFLKRLISDLNKCIEIVSADDRNIFLFFDYKYYQRLFLLRYFQEGYLYEKFDADDISHLDIILNHMSVFGANYINDRIKWWINNEIIKKEINQALMFERDNLKKYEKQLEIVKTKIVKAKTTK